MQLLYPLTIESTAQFTYCLDRPLQCIATKYTYSAQVQRGFVSESTSSCTLVFASGISLLQDTWIALMKELFLILSASPSGVKVNSIWVIERPNHGNAALLNAQVLKEHYSVRFPSLQYASAIHTFLTSCILSPSERECLMGIGHSGGGGSLIQALEYSLRSGHKIPLRTLVLLESPLIGPEAWPFFNDELYPNVVKSNSRRTSRWASKLAAMAWFRSHFPWKTFHPDVLRIIEDTYFIPDTDGKPGWITTKTTLEQETACFVDDGTQLQAYPFLQTILDVLPTHVVSGSLRDIWPAGLYDLNDEIMNSVRSRLASVTVVEGVGHYLPVVKPRETAVAIVKIIGKLGDSREMRSKL
ncbi:Alpha/beta-hydrolase [Mycena sanguinolenta]|uniref:Alpha/beta-hydrolase n=1 Tax=Mycena sanguinolenta TaxID=230812 RepID=A0A8H7D0H9_9AGAR|nr:Alpha/beta-hydrolase [Mycena sanguinolenta]